MVHFRHMPTATVEPEAVEGNLQHRFLQLCGSAAYHRPLRVLVIDDDRDTADSLTQVLRLLGHDTHPAYSGLAGMDMNRTLVPDVIICDLAMPGMDGYRLVEALREEPRETTFIAASGYSSEGDRARTQSAGFHLHLVKPLDLERLRDVLVECARRRMLRERV